MSSVVFLYIFLISLCRVTRFLLSSISSELWYRFFLILLIIVFISSNSLSLLLPTRYKTIMLDINRRMIRRMVIRESSTSRMIAIATRISRRMNSLKYTFADKRYVLRFFKTFKFITNAFNGFYQTETLTKFLSYLPDMYIHSARHNIHILSPDRFKKLIPCKNLTWIFSKEVK